MSKAATETYADINSLRVNRKFKEFIEVEVLGDLGISKESFWLDVERIIDELKPENIRLIKKRQEFQDAINEWHSSRKSSAWDSVSYKTFLRDIGYLVEPGPDFSIGTEHVDDEIAKVAGPQLVVPVSNSRFALNAANARWGSLYDAIYGSDIIDESQGRERGGAYNPTRGDAVIAYAADFLDRAVPLQGASHSEIKMYKLTYHEGHTSLEALLEDGTEVALENSEQFVGHRGENGRLTLLLRNNGLHIEIVIDSSHPIGGTAPANVADVLLESALTTIQDCEDSVAAVDADDKIVVYRNWLGLMRGTLSSQFEKGGKSVTRRLAQDRHYIGNDETPIKLSGRSLLLVRNVGHLMTNPAILDRHGEEIPEGILDAIVTATCALYDLRESNELTNSQVGCMYVVKPKMHGPEEVAFTDTLYARVEDMLGLDRNTIKIGVMDEERRTTVNLKACIREVKDRLVFINTGFLDRTGDEIHTSMHAGVMLPKEQIKMQPWIDAYERWNVDVGIACGLPGRAQIGKGMWAKPDELAEMVATKHEHLLAGANCAWVPSPTAATLHAMHYHSHDVFSIQEELSKRADASLEDILTPPLSSTEISEEDIESELRNSCQSILGYVVRWIDHGVGCSKVPDINDVGLMEDRATLRISSQLLANWLEHKVVSKARIQRVLEEMAIIVDRQNSPDPSYSSMAPDFESSIAFQAARDLVFLGAAQPNGYTEPLLHQRRLEKKG